jgi:uncharacterized membrane protein
MSAIHPSADVAERDRHVRFVPNGDICTAQKNQSGNGQTRLRSDAKLRPKLRIGHRNAAARHRSTGRNPATHSLVYFVCGAKALLEEAMANPQSTARIAGHPIHPMLIPFPIAFFVGTFACDVAYWITGNANWAMVTPWLLGAGIIMGALAALAGLTDVIGEQRIRALNDVWLHAGGMVIVILIEIYNWYARYTEGAAAILPKGIILSLVVVCILLFAGWMGWNMVYRHRVGIADEVVAVQSSATQRRAA